MSPRLLSGAARLAGSSLLRLQTDERLVALARSGHAPAFAAIVERYRDELLRYAERLVGRSRGEDVLQQALLNAHLAMPSTTDDLKLRAWLYRITHNVALNALRAARPQTALDDTVVAPGAIHDDLEARERLRAALEAIARLPEPQRDALTLQAIEGRSHEEVAAALGLSAGAARQSVHRARTTVRAAVSAITPYGLVARFAMAGSGSSVSGADLAAGGAGAAGLATKAAATLLAAGAVAGGATQLPPVHHHHAPRAGQAPEAAAAAPAAAPDSATRAPASVDQAGDDRGRRRGRDGRGAEAGDDRGRHDGGRRGSDDDGRGSSGPGSGDDDGGRSGSGDDRVSSSGSGPGPSSGSGDDGGSHSGSSTSDGDDRLASGTSGSDDGRSLSSGSGPAGTAPLTIVDGSETSGGSGSSDGGDSLSSGSGSGGSDDSLSSSGSGSGSLDD